MSRPARARVIGWLAALVALAASVGAATAAAVLTEPPEVLTAARPTVSVPVGHDTFDDARDIQLKVSAPASTHLFAPEAGKLTAFACEQGASIESGSAPVAIDGRPRLALATAVPLWRDVALQTRGSDVRAVQDELTRLGYPLKADGFLGRETLAAMKALLAHAGAPDEGDTVSVASLIWIPEPSAVVSSCDATIGATVDAAAPLATFGSSSSTAEVVSLPTDLLPGPRVVKIGDASVPLGAEGVIRIDDPASIGVAPSPDGAELPPKPIEAQLALLDAVDVAVIAPSAVYDIRGSEACVSHGQKSYQVHLVGSRLGQTLVSFSTHSRPDEVDLSPRNHRPCR